MFPFAAGFPSLTLEPTIIRLLYITPGDVIETYNDDEFSPRPVWRSMNPLLPNSLSGLPLTVLILNNLDPTP